MRSYFPTPPNLLRDRSVTEVIADIERVERRVGVATSRERRFVKVGSWLIESDHFRTLSSDLRTGRTATVVPFFSALPRTRAVLKVLRHWKIFQGVSARIAADAICVRNNLRTFHLMRPDPFSLKIPKPDADSRRAFQRDVEARARVLQHGFLSVPRIIDSDLTGDTPFLTEEVVFGRLPRLPADSDAVVELIQNPLWATYGKEGFRFKSVPQSMNVEDHASLLAKACAACRWDERWLPQNEFLRKADELLSGRGLMTFSFSHGDFGVHNILLTGHLDAHVIDWEHARRMITVRDLYRSIKEVPGVYEAVRERMAGLAASVQEKPILSMAEQFFMLALQPLLSWARRGRPNVSPAEQEKATAAVLQLSNWILLHERQLQQGTATAPFTTGLRRLCK